MIATKILAHKEPWRDCVSLLICETGYDGEVLACAAPLVMTKIEVGMAITEPTVRLSPTMAQVLIDELWNCGLRPTEGAGSAGSLKATERHLEDMRRLVFETGIGVCEADRLSGEIPRG